MALTSFGPNSKKAKSRSNTLLKGIAKVVTKNAKKNKKKK
jgi:hypothetical protein